MNNSVQNTNEFFQSKFKKELCFLKSKSIFIVTIFIKMMYGMFLILRFSTNFMMI